MATSFRVGLDQLAFYQPTSHGCALAAAYVGHSRFLVYDEYDGAEPTQDDLATAS